MAKRTPSRSEAADAATTPAPPKPRRMRGTADKRDMSSGPRPDAVDAGETSASEGASAGTMATDVSQRSSDVTPPATDVPRRPSDAAQRSDWSPTEEDIRVRAYHRYLERGGGNGMDFEDWLEAERELRSSKSEVRSQK